MKKNIMMRVASALLVATLLSTCTISGTYAKYVTQDSGSDQARVAKWGIALQVVGDLYGEAYDNTNHTKVEWSADDSAISVKAIAHLDDPEDDVVAPGTKNTSGLSFGLTGKPEVDYQIAATVVNQNIFLKKGTYGLLVPVEAGKITAENFSTDLYYAEGTVYKKATAYSNAASYFTLEDSYTLTNDYYPVVYKMTGDQEVTSSITEDSMDKIAKQIAKSLQGADVSGSIAAAVTTYTITSKVYDTNTEVDANDAVNLGNMSLTWEWAFENGSTDEEKVMYNGADTTLGNLMAARKGTLETGAKVVKLSAGTDYVEFYGATYENVEYCLDTQFSIDITVTQVD